MADIIIPGIPASALPLASSTTPGAMPVTRITQAQLNIIADSLSGGASGSFGEDRTTFDVSGLACDTKGGFLLVVQGFCKTTAHTDLYLRINGDSSNTNKSYSGWYSGNSAITSGASNPGIGSPNSTSGIAGTGWRVEISCPSPSSAGGALRVFHVCGSYYQNPTTRVLQVIHYEIYYKGTEEITDVGIASSAALEMAAATDYKLTRF